MRKNFLIWKRLFDASFCFGVLVLCLFFCVNLQAQKDSTQTIQFSGQLSAWSLYNPDIELNSWTGARYIPQLNYKKPLKQEKLLDAEASLNISGSLGTLPFDTTSIEGNIKPFRAWVRYSDKQMELRAGLQKINFGSATLFRPLRWFDQIDPRDPLQLTDGVYGLLYRHYFLNNANLWFWGLYGNKNRKGWEILKSAPWLPEIGGRYQQPVKKGEIAFSYHFRLVDTSDFAPIFDFEKSVENKFGFDGKWDLVVGLWFEGSYTHKAKNANVLKNQSLINIAIDYTFNLGNGLNLIFEQLLAANGQQSLDFSQATPFSALALSYPIGLFDSLSGFLYYDWNRQAIYNTLQYKHDFKNLSLNILGFWNPKNNQLPLQNSNQNLFEGKGLQVLIIYNH